MANASEWTALLTERKWLNEEGKLVAPGETIVKVQLPDGRSFTIRGGKPSPTIRIVGEFMTAREANVDSQGHERLTVIPLNQILSIESLY
jgi:hypothetical protein